MARGAVGLEVDVAHLGWRRVADEAVADEGGELTRARISVFSAISELPNLLCLVCGRSVASPAAEKDLRTAATLIDIRILQQDLKLAFKYKSARRDEKWDVNMQRPRKDEF